LAEIAAFTGFSKDTLKFYENIAKNNNREWFEAHRHDYMQHVIAPAQSFIVAAGKELAKVSPGVSASPDYTGKGSFKTYMDIMFWEGPVGAKKDNSAFFLRLTTKQVILVAGIKGFNSDVLKLYRQTLTDSKQAAALAAAVKKVEAEGYRIGGRGAYKVAPKGFAIDGRYLDLALCDGVFAYAELAIPAEFHTPGFVGFCVGHWRKMAPLHKWLAGMLAA
jgi:uncharacterized protein (TIGR02453 family)